MFYQISLNMFGVVLGTGTDKRTKVFSSVLLETGHLIFGISPFVTFKLDKSTADSTHEKAGLS